MAETVVSIVVGLVGLVIGADFLVRGAVAVARRIGVSSLVIGLTLVGFGTSVPETATAIHAVLAGAPAMAVGNIVGANIANCLLIVGLATAITPVAVPESLIRREGSALTVATLLFVAWGTSFPLGRASGMVMLVLLGLYLWLTFSQESTPDDHDEETTTADLAREEGWRFAFWRWVGAFPLASALILVAGGVLLIVYSGSAFVDGAAALAQLLGVSNSVIGLSVVAIGTTAPEMVTSAVAAMRGRPGLAVGNAIGSCFYNLLGIGGLIGLMGPVPIPDTVARFDFPVLVAATLLVLVLASTGRRIARPEGFALLACYAVYLFALFR
ncbi:MAG TPA: calcium/sodium antiporter [Rhizobiales bacterium]|nr:calcium/sodium antiporter [Hyphomicrobiales bacterium]